MSKTRKVTRAIFDYIMENRISKTQKQVAEGIIKTFGVKITVSTVNQYITRGEYRDKIVHISEGALMRRDIEKARKKIKSYQEEIRIQHIKIKQLQRKLIEMKYGNN